MALVMTPIYTQTVGAGGAASVTFNNIPQVYTDLQIKISSRITSVTSSEQLYLRYNGDSTALYSTTRIYGGASTASDRFSSAGANVIGGTNGTQATSGAFAYCSVYIPNYSGSNFKSNTSEQAAESNDANVYVALNASLYRSTNAITSITLLSQSGNPFVQYSTFSLYGIIRSGA